MSRTQSTENQLFGGNETKIWVAPTKILHIEKGDVKFIVKLVEFDYDTVEDHVLVDVSSNSPSDLIETSVTVFQQNDLTKPIVNMLQLDKREILRRTQMHAAYDALLIDLVQTLQAFTRWV